jgi:hypothetical protein
MLFKSSVTALSYETIGMKSNTVDKDVNRHW